MAAISKKDVTVLFPCYNEQSSIEHAIKQYEKAGYTNFLVVNDDSSDKTADLAKKLGARVISNNGARGYLITALKGIYSIKTDFGLIADPYIRLEPKTIEEFVSFGQDGNYGMLISKSDSRQAHELTRLLKKRFGLFLLDPGFEVVFLNKTIIDATKIEESLGGAEIYFDLIKIAILNKLKIGVYPLGIKKYHFKRPILWFLFRSRFKVQDGAEHSHKKYFKYAFPNVERQRIFDEIVVKILIGLGGALITLVGLWLRKSVFHIS